MGTDILAWVDYDEWDGYVSTLADIHLPRDYVLFGLLAGVREDRLLDLLTIARADAPESMAEWDRKYGQEVVALRPNGLPERLGNGPKRALVDLGFAPPGHHLFGKPRPGAGDGVYSWPPQSDHAYFGYSSLSHVQLKLVADRYALLPRVVDASGVPPTYVALRPAPPGLHVVYGDRHPEIEAVIAMMAAINCDNPDRSRFIFWFEN